MLKEFKEFALKGNMFDMAVGIIIGAAFTTVVGSLVADIVSPVVGLGVGGFDFTQLFLVLKEGTTPGPYLTMAAAEEAGAVTLNWGKFINEVITFLMVAGATFMLVKGYNAAKRKEEAAPPPPAAPPADVVLLTEIRDLLARTKTPVI